MKKIILLLLLAFISMPTVNVLASNTIDQKNFDIVLKSATNSKIENFFNTESFLKISKNFNIKKENFDLKNVEIIKVDDNSSLIRFAINNNDRIDYVMIMPNNAVLYEKSLVSGSGNGNIEQYDENGILLANFAVTKKDGKFNVKLNFVSSSTLFGDQLTCIKKNYDYIKSTCDKDTTCSIACDLSPQCAIVMYGVAAARCAADGNKPVKATFGIYAE